eukprot:SAG31_NODE_179_length_21090_cov_11.862871_6_plen_95_part_00
MVRRCYADRDEPLPGLGGRGHTADLIVPSTQGVTRCAPGMCRPVGTAGKNTGAAAAAAARGLGWGASLPHWCTGFASLPHCRTKFSTVRYRPRL